MTSLTPLKFENGQTLRLAPSLIDVAKSEQTTQPGLGSVAMFTETSGQPATPAQPQSTLGSAIRLRKLPPAGAQQAAPPPPVTPSPAAGGGRPLGNDVIDKFERAYENV